jgi:Inhibitor of growth proteins N-terminal histone-binding
LKEIDVLADDYLKGVRGMDGEHRKEHLNGIQKLFNQSKKFSEEKVQLAMQTYEMVG